MKNFAGIKTIGAAGLFSILALFLNSWGLGFLASNKISYTLIIFLLEKYVNLLTNHGIILLNVGADKIQVPKDKEAYVSALEKAIEIVNKSTELNQAQIEEIDNEVIDAFNKFAVYRKLPISSTP